MATFGIYSIITVLWLFISIALMAASIATRGWITGYYYGDLEIGLFTMTVGGTAVDIKTYFPTFQDEFLTAAVLICVGGALEVVATISLLVFLLLKKKKASAILLYMAATILSCILSLAGTIYFRINIYYSQETYYLNLDYSWYLALVSTAFGIWSIAPMGRALKRGEADTGVVERVNTTSVTNQIQFAGKV